MVIGRIYNTTIKRLHNAKDSQSCLWCDVSIYFLLSYLYSNTFYMDLNAISCRIEWSLFRLISYNPKHIWVIIFKPGMQTNGQCMPGFLKVEHHYACSFVCVCVWCLCVCVCLSTTKTSNILMIITCSPALCSKVKHLNQMWVNTRLSLN